MTTCFSRAPNTFLQDLLAQVLSLTPEQVNSLPPMEREQIQHLVSATFQEPHFPSVTAKVHIHSGINFVSRNKEGTVRVPRAIQSSVCAHQADSDERIQNTSRRSHPTSLCELTENFLTVLSLFYGCG